VLPDSSTLALFVAAAVALVLMPGPAVLYIVAQSIDQGRVAGLVSALGIGAGGLVHVAAATLGLSSLLVSSATAFTVVKYAGAAYLVFLGLRRLFASDEADVHLRRQKTRRRLFSQGIVVNVLNPKAALFFFAFLPQFVDVSRGSVALQIATLGIVFVAIALVSDGLYALLAGTLAGWLRGKARFLKAQRYVSGTVLVGLGVATALSGPGRARSTFPQALRG
jgi:threonine/homoserine/homoserine lactone efflux protein